MVGISVTNGDMISSETPKSNLVNMANELSSLTGEKFRVSNYTFGELEVPFQSVERRVTEKFLGFIPYRTSRTVVQVKDEFHENIIADINTRNPVEKDIVRKHLGNYANSLDGVKNIYITMN